MNLKNKRLLISSLIFIGLFVTFLPVLLSNNYLRQDDLMWEIWPGMKMSDFGYLYYNTVYQLVRPLCMLSFYTTDLISIDIHNAVYVRLWSVIMIAILGILLYRWQLLFSKSEHLMAAVFAIAAFTLPPYQVFVSTANYTLIINALLLTFGAMYCWYYSYYVQKKGYLLAGCILFFLSLLEYPLSSMYVWALLTICTLNNLTADQSERIKNNKFIFLVSRTVICLMLTYYVFSRVFHTIFHVDLNTSRASVVDTHHLASRLLQIFDVLSWHADLWLWKTTHSLLLSPILAFIAIVIFALFRLGKMHGNMPYKSAASLIASVMASLFVFFFMAYSLVLATPDFQATYRYGLVTMPILLYAVVWAINTIVNSYSQNTLGIVLKVLLKISFIGMAFFAIGYSNIMIADAIVGPHHQEFAYVQAQLQQKVIPLLKNNKQVLIHAIDCDNGKRYFKYNAPNFEYGMRICQYQQQVISVIVHSLRRMGIASNYNNHNTVIYHDNEIIVKDMPWGTLVVNGSENEKNDLSLYADHDKSLVTIDMREIPQYQRFDFYKSFSGLRPKF